MKLRLKPEQVPIHLKKYFKPIELKPKDDVLVPDRLRLELQRRGWWVRSTFGWYKANCLPESCRDRLSKSHEEIIMLTKSAKYWWDADAIRMKANDPRWKPICGWRSGDIDNSQKPDSYFDATREVTGRNRRTGDAMNESVDWQIERLESQLAHLRQVKDKGGLLLDEEGLPVALFVNPQAMKGLHYATYPEKLVEPFVKVACPEKCCPECGAGWVRVTDKEFIQRGNDMKSYDKSTKTGWDGFPSGTTNSKTLGWQPSCECGITDTWTPGVVLDPFSGAGTTCLVASRLNRDSIGFELNESYIDMSKERIEVDSPLLNQLTIG